MTADLDGVATGAGLRVVLLSKPHALTTHLEQTLAAAGFLVGVVYESRHQSLRSRFATIGRVRHQQGPWRALDVAAYEAFERLARRAAFHRAVREEIPPRRPGRRRGPRSTRSTASRLARSFAA